MFNTVPLGAEPPHNVDPKAELNALKEIPLYHASDESLEWLPLMDKERKAWTLTINGEFGNFPLGDLIGHEGVGFFMCASEKDAQFCRQVLINNAGYVPDKIEIYETTVHLVGSATLGATLSLIWGNFCRKYWGIVAGDDAQAYADIPRRSWEGNMTALVWVDLENETIAPIPLPLTLDMHHAQSEPGKMLDGLLPAWHLPDEIEGGPEGQLQFMLQGFGTQPPLWALAGISEEHKVLHFPIVLKDPEDNQMHTPLFADSFAAQGAIIDLAPALAQHGVAACALPLLSPTQLLEILGVVKVHNDVMVQNGAPENQATIVCMFDADTMFHLTPDYLKDRMVRTNLINSAALGFQLEVCTARTPSDVVPRVRREELDNPFMLPSTFYIGQLYADMLAGPLMSAAQQSLAQVTESEGIDLGAVSDREDPETPPE